MRLRRLSTSLLFGFAVLGSQLKAQAFCLTHGCNDRKQNCEYDERECLITGPLLHWGSSCVSFDVQQDGSSRRGISYEAAHGAVVDAFSQWLNADCGEGVVPDIKVNDYGPVACRSPEYNQDAPNANVIMFRDQNWPYANAIDTLALTTLIFNADSGEIYDADIEVNTFQSAMTIDEVTEDGIDFRSVITHEVGHFLGLSHSDVFGSTMRANYAPGQTDMASIDYDDVEGICTALPVSRKVARTSCDPRHGFSSECALEPTSCSVSPRGRGGSGSLALGLLGLSAVLLRKRSRPSSPRA